MPSNDHRTEDKRSYRPTCETDGHIMGITADGVEQCVFCKAPAPKKPVSEQEPDDVEGMTVSLLETFSKLRAAMARDGLTLEMHLSVKGAQVEKTS